MKRESVEEFLGRGGSILQLPSSLPPVKPRPVLSVVKTEETPHDYNPPRSKKPVKYVVTPKMHEQIRKVYQLDTRSNAIKELARRLGLPRWKVSRYAISQGWVAVQKKESAWSDKEIHILRRWAHLVPERIQLKLKQAGYRRTATAIALKRKRTGARLHVKGESANSMSICMGVDRHVILNAIGSGKLKAKKEGKWGPNEVYFIRWKDIKRYLIDYIAEIDIRKVDKYWFVDMITGNW